MANVRLTVETIVNLGLWDKVCEYKGWEPWIINEGQIEYDDFVEFDDKFKEEETDYDTPEEKIKHLYDSYYGQGDFGYHVTGAIKKTLDAFEIKVKGVNC